MNGFAAKKVVKARFSHGILRASRMKHLSIDIETFSSEPIAKTGSYKYIQSPDFEILLFAYSVDDSPVEIIDLAQGEKIPAWLINALQNPEYIKHAYNASFEWYCLSRYCGYPLPVNQWRDTMLHGLYCGFTAGLDAMGKALGLPEDKRKLSTGKALIRYFSVPCNPTKANGYRMRNYPKHDPDKWELFKEYCMGDVVTEMEIEKRLSKFPVPEDIELQWQTDLVINSRGVAVDNDLVQGALDIANASKNSLIKEAIEITGLDNPNSVTQLSKWLENETSETVSDLQKDTVARMLKKKTVTCTAERVLQIRQELGKTSIKKYNAIETAVCADGKVRGLLQFYGASRSGRWAGRLVQVQNLARTYIDVNLLPLARKLVKQHDSEKLNLLFGSVMDTLSQLIRTSFVASEGNVLVDADFSSIEARIIAWLAGEKWKLEVFKQGGDVYCETASSMFGVPVEKHGVNSHLRQKGKIAELACIAECQLVLTNKGLVPIEQITLEHYLWDGIEWVQHEGIIYRGEKEVIEYDGLTATADHEVYIEGQSRSIQFGIAAASGAHLVRTGNRGIAIRLGENYIARETLGAQLESLLCSDTMHQLQQSSMANSEQSDARSNHSIGETSGNSETQKLAQHRRKVRVYDIRNAGPRHRFTVSGCLVHNCGYGGSAGALIAMGALDMGIPEEDLQDIVVRWRQANKMIVSLWYRVEEAAISAIQSRRQINVNGLIFSREFDLDNHLDFLTIRLPSGRKLFYASPEIGENQWGKPSIVYHGVNQTSKQWTTIETYGGKLVENIVQSIARDCLALTIENLEKAGYPIVFHIHDEVVIDCPKDKANLAEVIRIMTQPIVWAKDLPINADGWIGEFFRKD